MGVKRDEKGNVEKDRGRVRTRGSIGFGDTMLFVGSS
jgi:hypothetical protein